MAKSLALIQAQLVTVRLAISEIEETGTNQIAYKDRSLSRLDLATLYARETALEQQEASAEAAAGTGNNQVVRFRNPA